MRVTCPNCGGDHPRWDCKAPATKLSAGERIVAQAVHGFSGGDAVRLGIPAVSNKPADDAAKFDKKEWQKIYMREHRKGIRRRVAK